MSATVRVLSVLLALMFLAMSEPGIAAMPDGSEHSSMHNGMVGAEAPDHQMSDDIAHRHQKHHQTSQHNGGGCQVNLMDDCCLMTCFGATIPDIMPGPTRHGVNVVETSRPTEPASRVIGPLLHPPKRSS